MRHRLLVLLIVFGCLSVQALPKVHESRAVVIGGIKQWISIEGASPSLPVLLFLHGGPGNSAMPYASKFTGLLQNHFLVVQWDQRETGHTLRLNPSPQPLTVALMVQDAVEMIRYLSNHFSQEKIYLMGHSWGGFLGLCVAAEHPELLRAYLAVSPMINQLESERLSLQWLKEQAKQNHNDQALSELDQVHIPFENGAELYYHRRWLAQSAGTKIPSKAYVETWSKTWLTLFNEACAVNFFVKAPEIRCPIIFFIGKKDYQTHFQLADDYYQALKAGKKQLFWFVDSGHNLILTEPNKFQEIVIRELAP